MTVIYALLVAHFVADFLAQTDWMALNKSKRWDALAWHVAIYTAVLQLIVSFTQPPSEYPYTSLKLFGLFVVVNAVAHFVQDALTSRLTSRLWFFEQVGAVTVRGVSCPAWKPTESNHRHWFFVAIGFDQLLHYITLFVTAGWWLR